MKGYYIILYPISEISDSGIWKKIQSQIRIFNNAGLETKLLDCSCNTTNLFGKIKKRIYPYCYTKSLPDDFYFYDFYYIRYGYSNIPFIELLKKIKQHGRGKIIIEIPTYPYYKEFEKGLQLITLLLDKIFNKQLKKYVDRITTYSKHEVIFNIPTIQISNGVECSMIPVNKKMICEDNSINLVGVSSFAIWHGYDRLISGLYNYNKQGLFQKVYIHLVGDGPELNTYKKIVQQYGLSEYVIFHGLLFKGELTEIFNKSDIAICSLGGHRKGLYLSSELKSREYLARGMPMISSTKIDVLPDEFKYCLYVPEDESPINIQTVIQFYNNLVVQKNIFDISREIRQFAENYCDMSKTMKPVINYLSHI